MSTPNSYVMALFTMKHSAMSLVSSLKINNNKNNNNDNKNKNNYSC